MNCDRCRADLPNDARFCPQCGAAVLQGGATDGERRNLTVMFCDLVGSVALSTRLDPEDLRNLLRSYQHACAQVVARFKGHVAQYLGDGILVYFGYPAAREDDALRTVRAAIGIVASCRSLAGSWSDTHGVDLQVRIGIHTGLAVIGDMGAAGQEARLATGKTPNVAARIQGAAEPFEILVSHATYSLIHGYFNCESVGEQPLKGIEQPMRLYRVLCETGAKTRLAAAGDAGLLPFVGRGSAIDLLLAGWCRACEGEGQVVQILGDAGIGKSRLLRALRDRVGPEDATYLEVQCSPYAESSAFSPMIDLVERELGISRASSEAVRLEQLTACVEKLIPDGAGEAVSLLAGLLSIPFPETHPRLDFTPQRQRRRTIETLTDLVIGAARRRRTLLAIEDLHWSDPSTLELLDEIVAQAPGAPLLVLLTFRPEFIPPWTSRRNVSEMELEPLPEEGARSIVVNVTKGRTLPEAIVRQVLERAEGNPLYLEEITKLVIDAGGQASGEEVETSALSRLIPATVQDSLLARFDQVGPAKAVAQLASAFGRQFSYRLLCAIPMFPPHALDDGLSRLIAADLVVQEQTGTDVRFTFKHALLRDAAYQSLLRARRQEIHSTIAQVLCEQFLEICESQPELPAQHFTEAGRTREAIVYWKKAGDIAVTRSANTEAGVHLARALELVRTLPADPTRIEAELSLLISLGPVFMATRGYANPLVESTYQQARELCRQIGDTPQVVPVLFGLWAFYVVRGDLHTAHDLGRQILRAVGSTHDSGILLEAHVVLGCTLFFLGEFEQARRALESSTALYRPEEHRPHALVFGQEPGMASHIYLAKVLALMGDMGGARRHAARAAAIARETAHHHTSAFCMVYDMVVRNLAGDVRGTAAVAQRCIDLSQEQGFPIWKAAGEVLSGWTRVQQGDETGVGLRLMLEGLDHWQLTGTGLYGPYWRGLIAAAHAAEGNLERAQEEVEAALAGEVEGEERFALAELQRLRAEILACRGTGAAAAQARAGFLEALQTARAQRASLWELRAAIGLARLDGSLEELKKLVDNWPEDGACADLETARAVLAAKARRRSSPYSRAQDPREQREEA